MRLTPAGYAALVREEGGPVLKAYRCPAGVWTIGIGCTFYQDGHLVKQGDTLTEAEADALAAWHIEEIEKQLGGLVKVPVNPGQWDALVSLAFNIGMRAFAHSTLLMKLNAGDFAGAAAEFPRWSRIGIKENAGLLTRRHRERAMFEAGDSAPIGSPEPAKASDSAVVNEHLTTAAPIEDRSTPDPYIAAELAERKPMIPALIPIFASAAAELIPAIGKLIWDRDKSVPERNVAIASEVLKTVVQATGAANEQEAIEKIKADPAVLAEASKAVEARFFELQEAGGGGIQGAREFSAKMTGQPGWQAAGYGALIAVLSVLIVGGGGWMMAALLFDPATSAEQKGMLIGALVAFLSAVIGYFFGSSVGSKQSGDAVRRIAEKG